MTTLELDDDEKAALVDLLRAQTKNTRWRAPHTKALRSILAKLEPPPPRPEPFPVPKSSRRVIYRPRAIGYPDRRERRHLPIVTKALQIC